MPAPESISGDGKAGPARIGLLGGTFDPPHNGHVAAAVAARDRLSLDQVLLVVANQPWQKTPTRAVTPVADRVAMAQEMALGLPGVEVSTVEVERGGPSYTVDTVEQLHAEAGAAGGGGWEIFVIVGADLVAGLPTWERVEELACQSTLAVVTRPQSPIPAIPLAWPSVIVDGPMVDVSSSGLRERMARGLPIDELVPKGVVRCIRRRGLYAIAR